MYLSVISLIEALWHAEDDLCPAIIADQHPVIRKGDALDLTLQGNVIQR